MLDDFISRIIVILGALLIFGLLSYLCYKDHLQNEAMIAQGYYKAEWCK